MKKLFLLLSFLVFNINAIYAQLPDPGPIADNVTVSGTLEIGETYVLQPADDGKWITFEVTPSNGLETGNSYESMPVGPVGSGGADVTPPVFQNGTPTILLSTENSVSFNVDLDEDGTVYFVVVPDGATPPGCRSGTSRNQQLRCTGNRQRKLHDDKH